MKDLTFTEKMFAWGRLLRVPNLFTAPWDPVCGFLLAGGAVHPEKTGFLAAGALCAYAFGLLTNDIADLKTDEKERPDRPLPAGEISLKAASIAAVALCFLALELISIAGQYTCFGMMGLLVTILLYNYCGRSHSLLSPALMALCRVLSFGLGVIAALPGISPVSMTLCILFACGYFLFIFGITLASRRETDLLPCRPGRMPMFLGALLALCAGAVWTGGMTFSLMQPVSGAFLLLFILAAAAAWRQFGEKLEPAAVQKRIGSLIRSLILLQGALILPASPVCGIVVVCCLPLAVLASRKFYGS